MRYVPENTSRIGRPVDVYVDGRKVKWCIEADDLDGFARVLRDDGLGNPVILPDGTFDDEVITGRVIVQDLEAV